MIDSEKDLSISKDENYSFIIVRNSIEKFFLKYFYFIIPGIYLFRSLLQFISSNSIPKAFLDLVKIPSELSLMIALFCSSILFKDTRYFLTKFLYSKSVSDLPSNCDNLKDFKKVFLIKSDRRLNQRIRICIGVLASSLVLIYYIQRLGGAEQLFSFVSKNGFSFALIDRFLYIFPSVVYSYFAGVIIWKFFIISDIIRNIPTDFKIKVQTGHPDGVGGLLPIGQICLKMFYVAVVPTVISALILFIPYLTPPKFHTYIAANKVALFYLIPLGLLIGIIGSIISLTPLFKYHIIMRKNKVDLDRKINDISQRIIELKEQLYDHLFQKNKNGIELIESKLRAMINIHDEYNKLGNWPINKNMIVKVWAALTFLLSQLSLFISFVKKFAVF